MKKKKVQNENNFLQVGSTDYSHYEFTAAEKALWFSVGAVVVAIVAFIFYEKLFICVLAAIVGGYAFIPIRAKQLMEKRRLKLQVQFKDMLESLGTSLGAGKNMPDSLSSAHDDMMLLHSPEADITRELGIMLVGIQNNLNIEDLLMDFGRRSGLPDVLTFSDVFETCFRKGGDIREIIINTQQVIVEKMEISMEIQTMITGKKTEQTAMMFTPIVFVGVLKSMGGGLVDLSSPIGMLASTVAIGVFVASYFLSKKILTIKI